MELQYLFQDLLSSVEKTSVAPYSEILTLNLPPSYILTLKEIKQANKCV